MQGHTDGLLGKCICFNLGKNQLAVQAGTLTGEIFTKHFLYQHDNLSNT